jgi:hypothetical protein
MKRTIITEEEKIRILSMHSREFKVLNEQPIKQTNWLASEMKSMDKVKDALMKDPDIKIYLKFNPDTYILEINYQNKLITLNPKGILDFPIGLQEDRFVIDFWFQVFGEKTDLSDGFLSKKYPHVVSTISVDGKIGSRKKMRFIDLNMDNPLIIEALTSFIRQQLIPPKDIMLNPDNKK